MTHRGGILVKRTLPANGNGKPAATSPAVLPLFSIPELATLQQERGSLLRKLTHQRLDVRSRIRIEQKVAILTARILRLELRIGGRA
jgi:hypothetical protein